MKLKKAIKAIIVIIAILALNILIFININNHIKKPLFKI